VRRAALVFLVALPVWGDELRERHGAAVERILGAALAQGGAARYAQQLSDGIGPRLAGSPGDAVRVTLRLGCETRPEAESANVIAELRGRERHEEVVLVGAHLDAWDLGTARSTMPPASES
jgi:hypothetical protein